MAARQHELYAAKTIPVFELQLSEECKAAISIPSEEGPKAPYCEGALRATVGAREETFPRVGIRLKGSRRRRTPARRRRHAHVPARA